MSKTGKAIETLTAERGSEAVETETTKGQEMTPRYTASDFLKAANCIYIAVDKPVADEIAAMLRQAAAEVTRLTERWAALGLWLEGEDTRTIGREDDHGKGQNLICEMAKAKMAELEAQR